MMRFEELKLGTVVYIPNGDYISFYFIDKWTHDESDPLVYYFPEIQINEKNNTWFWYNESFLAKKDANEAYHHLVGNCRKLDMLPVDEMQKAIKTLLGGKTS